MFWYRVYGEGTAPPRPLIAKLKSRPSPYRATQKIYPYNKNCWFCKNIFIIFLCLVKSFFLQNSYRMLRYTPNKIYIAKNKNCWMEEYLHYSIVKDEYFSSQNNFKMFVKAIRNHLFVRLNAYTCFTENSKNVS